MNFASLVKNYETMFGQFKNNELFDSKLEELDRLLIEAQGVKDKMNALIDKNMPKMKFPDDA